MLGRVLNRFLFMVIGKKMQSLVIEQFTNNNVYINYINGKTMLEKRRAHSLVVSEMPSPFHCCPVIRE